jgi:hypothetical protein
MARILSLTRLAEGPGKTREERLGNRNSGVVFRIFTAFREVFNKFDC